MIGAILHLAALVPAALAARVTRTALGLLCRVPQGSEVEQLAAECDVLRGERDFARGQVADLRRDLSSSRSRFTTLKALFDARGDDLAEAERELDAAEAEAEHVAASLQAGVNFAVAMSNDALRGERDALRAQLADAQASASQLFDECVRLKRDASEARLEHAAAAEVCEELRGLLATARKERDAARAEVDLFEAEIKRLRLLVESGTTGVQAVLGEREQARKERDDAQTLAHEARADAAQLRAQLAELRALALRLTATWTAHMVPETSVPGWAWAEVKTSIADLIAALPPEAEK